MVGAPVAELEFVGFRPERQAEQLVAEADAEYRQLSQQPADGFYGVGDRCRIAGAVAEEYAVRFVGQRLLRRCGRGHHRHLAAERFQDAQDVELDPKIVRHHVIPVARSSRVPIRTALRTSRS